MTMAKTLHNSFIETGKTDYNNPVFKKVMLEVKSIIPPKINLSKYLLTNFVNQCLLRDTLILFICSILSFAIAF